MTRRSEMKETMVLQQRWVRWGLIFGFWTLLGVFFGIQLYLINALEYRHPISWRQAMFWALSDWYIWAMLSPLVLWLARLFHLSRESWAQDLLEALKMQLHPHFLFNTLHAISALMYSDLDAADRMLARLSELLRLTLRNVGAQEVTLKQELEFLEHYLEIEQTRFADRLAV